MSKSMETVEPIADFYQWQTRLYKALGMWQVSKEAAPRRRVIYNIYFWHIVFCWLLSWDCSLLVQFYINIASLVEVIKVFFIFATAVAVLFKYAATKRQCTSYMELYKCMHSPAHLPMDAQEVQILNRAARLSRKVRNGYAGISLLAAHSLLVAKPDAGRLAFSFYNPIGLDSVWRYCVSYGYQYFAIMLLCLTNIAFDSISASLFIYLQAQLEMLAYRLEHVGHRTDVLNAFERHELIARQLKDCIRFYHRIERLTRRVERLVSIPMSAQIFCSILVLITNFYAIAVFADGEGYMTIFKFVNYQAAMMSQIFMLCLFANNVSMVSAELPLRLYNADWIHWTKSNRRLMLMMMHQFAEPIRINSINRCYSFNLAAFTSIVNSSYSYFALLKNTRKE